MAIILDDLSSYTTDAVIANSPTTDFDFGQDGGGVALNQWYARAGGPGNKKYMEHLYEYVAGGSDGSAYVVRDFTPVTATMGTTYYLGCFINMAPQSGSDIWQRTEDSGDKGTEFVGNGARWVIGQGNWSPLTNNPSGKFTVFVGNPAGSGSAGHLNSGSETNDIYPHNASGYNSTTPYRLNYNQWYATVLELKASKTGTGEMRLYVNGTKIAEYTSINTWDPAVGTSQINGYHFGGTVHQPNYSLAPNHYRRRAYLIITDSLTEIQDAGLMADPEAVASTELTVLSRVTERVFR